MTVFSTSSELNINYKGKLFQKPKCEFTVSHTVPEGDDAYETKLLAAAYAKLWKKGFGKLEKKRAGEFKKAMDGTEKDIAKKNYSPEQMNKFIDVANQLIKQGLKTFQSEARAFAAACMEKVYEYVEKKLKRKMRRKLIKAVLKVTALILITLVVAAASIAAIALSDGALFPVIAVSIVTALGALVGSAKIIYKEVNDYKGYLKKIEKDLVKLDEAVAYQEKKKKASEFRKLGPKEKAKLLMSGTAGHVKSLKKHLEAASGRIILMRKGMLQAMVDASEARENAEKMKSHPDKSISGEAEKVENLAKKLEYKFSKFEVEKKKFDQLKSDAETSMKNLETKGTWDGGRLAKAMTFIDNHQETANFMIKAVQALFKSGKKISKAVG